MGVVGRVGRLPAGIRLLFAAWILVVPVSVSAAMNPVTKGLPTVQVYGENFGQNIMSALCVACHARTAVPYSDNTVIGSHFVYRDASHLTRNLAVWEKIVAWDNTTFSKYGNNAAANQPPGTPGEMICESCHNMKKNTGVYKLLASDSESTDPNALCMGCHTLPSMTGHHPMTGDLISTRDGLPLKTAGGSAYAVPLDNATYPGSDRLNCWSCHRPHKAQTVTGARVLKKGIGAGVLGVSGTGVDRQYDISPTGDSRLVTDYTPLCDSCHGK